MSDRVIDINGTVAPQMFAIKDKSIYVFDKINRQEGRFYKYIDGCGIVLKETQEGQGIILSSGEMYYISIKEKSTIYCFNKDGSFQKSFTLGGMFYDIKLDSSGNLICLGNLNGLSIIKILRSNGFELSSFIPSEIIFASSIYTEGDYIYVGGFDEKYIFKILMLNYAGVILKRWSLNCESQDRIINKIQKFGSKIVASISGREDYLAIIDIESSKYNILEPECIGIKNIIDFNIYGNYIYILDGSQIFSYNMDNILSMNTKAVRRKTKDNFAYAPYGYLINLYAVKDILKNYFVVFYLVYGISISILLTFLRRGNIQVFILFSSLYWLLSMCTIEISAMTLLVNKSKRIDYLLNISKNIDIKAIMVPNVFLSIMISLIYAFFFAASFNIAIWVTVFISSLAFFCIYGQKTISRINSYKNIIIELLNDNDEKINKYVRDSIDIINSSKSEKFILQITALDDIKNSCISEWIDSRRCIIGKNIDVSLNGKSVSITMDLSKRDIRYSKFTIVMDCISYIKMFFEIKEIEIRQIKEYHNESA